MLKSGSYQNKCKETGFTWPWKVMEFEICIPGLEVMEISQEKLSCLGHGKVMEFQFQKSRKLCVKHQNVQPVGHFSHCLKSAVLLSILRSWNWIKSHGIFFPSFWVNPEKTGYEFAVNKYM